MQQVGAFFSQRAISQSVFSQRVFAKSLGLVVACLMLVGCDSGNPNLTPYSGSVTLDGAPLVGAELIFTPTGAEGGSSMATTDEQGRFEMYYSVGEKGVWLGSHQVTISKVDDQESGVWELVPPGYNTQSELTVVAEEGGNSHDFALVSGDWDPKKSRQAR